jgi:hypothetical protein
MAKKNTQTYLAAIAFKDANGSYAANSKVTLPAETEAELQEIATLLNYGVIKPVPQDTQD